ncbi:uncharacterized protein LOC133206099 [Saccostrea echinata]|uniref:uncharacterized protein LOC133206099 n=1 Tax=Saccostrea echinata TaxID=191078 RepID=UPI002A809D4E|nr:uncharacterized protein LOC133206099 [Saccostrea echinata]
MAKLLALMLVFIVLGSIHCQEGNEEATADWVQAAEGGQKKGEEREKPTFGDCECMQDEEKCPEDYIHVDYKNYDKRCQREYPGSTIEYKCCLPRHFFEVYPPGVNEHAEGR